MSPGQAAQLLAALLKIPVGLIFLALMNFMNLVAPGLTFVLIKKMMGQVGEDIEGDSTRDFAMMFQLDSIKVPLCHFFSALVKSQTSYHESQPVVPSVHFYFLFLATGHHFSAGSHEAGSAGQTCT